MIRSGVASAIEKKHGAAQEIRSAMGESRRVATLNRGGQHKLRCAGDIEAKYLRR